MDSDSLSRLLGPGSRTSGGPARTPCYFFNRQTIRRGLERAGFEVLRIDSYGLTIPMSLLARRAKLALPRAGAVMERLVRWSGLSRQQLHFDPRTKMIVYARKPAL